MAKIDAGMQALAGKPVDSGEHRSRDWEEGMMATGTSRQVMPTAQEVAELPARAVVALAARCARRALAVLKSQDQDEAADAIEKLDALVLDIERFGGISITGDDGARTHDLRIAKAEPSVEPTASSQQPRAIAQNRACRGVVLCLPLRGQLQSDPKSDPEGTFASPTVTRPATSRPSPPVYGPFPSKSRRVLRIRY